MTEVKSLLNLSSFSYLDVKSKRETEKKNAQIGLCEKGEIVLTIIKSLAELLRSREENDDNTVRILLNIEARLSKGRDSRE